MPAPPLAEACALLELDAHGAQLLHLRANAVYHLPRSNFVLRLRHAPGNAAVLERARAAVQITTWLADEGFPTIRPLAVDQPATVNGWIATVWHYVTNKRQALPHPQDLAQLLRRLHHLDPPVTVPASQPLGTLRADLTSSPAGAALTVEQRTWLLDRCARIETARAELDPPLGYGLLHGDAHTGNLFFDGTRWLLGDWDSVAYGPRLQDFIPMMMGHRRFGRPYALWTSFCHAYGIDPELEHHPAARLLRSAREIRSLAAYIRSADQPDIRAELQRRLGSLMDGTSTIWHPI
ncbi:aminoglycoside phosphotransferase family protein [Nonomuraea bangladeshensis]|uniref:phosphotransferase enzyme family protein n=1 Tax=Nonomuraea bangladeshensis TaxID=404385 RepID=UPI0031E3D85A